VRVPVESLKSFQGNPRIGDVSLIAESLEANGQYRPIVVRKSTREILAGNHTWQAAKLLGWREIWIVEADVDLDTAKRIVAVDNRTNDVARYDDEALAKLLGSLDDLVGTGYTPDDLDALLASLTSREEPTALTDPDDIPDVPEVAQSRFGQVWTLGPHRLLVGDATQDLSALMQGDLADLVLTDPPYNVDYEGGTGLKIENDKLLADDFRELLYGAYSSASDFSKPGAGIYVFHADSERVNFQTMAENAGWSIRQNLVWVKSALVMGRQDYHWQHEPILYGWLSGAGHKWYGDRKQTTVIEWDKPSRNADHPTMKPVGLIQYLLSNSTQTGDIVLDPFAGSGSTLIACHATARKSRLVELDPKYADVILRRYMEHTGDTPTCNGQPFRLG
jgi:DNA modification methylase